jgi:hypothetical protein
MNYELYETDIISYFTTALPTALAAITTQRADGITLPNPNEYVVGYPDTTLHPSSIVVYLVPTDYAFAPLSNQSNEMTNRADIYVVLTGIAANLSIICRRYAEAIHDAVKADKTLGGTADFAIISDVHLYDAVEGFPTSKAIKVVLNVTKESN